MEVLELVKHLTSLGATIVILGVLVVVGCIIYQLTLAIPKLFEATKDTLLGLFEAAAKIAESCFKSFAIVFRDWPDAEKEEENE